MKIPKTIAVGRTKYRVASLTPAHKYDHGRLSYERREIQIRKGMTPKQQTHTFWHEVVHAILYDMGSPKYRDEAFVDGIGKRIAGVVNSARF